MSEVNESTCKGCHAPVLWIKVSLKAQIVNKAVTVTYTEEGVKQVGHMSHFATCPTADRFRKK